MNAKEQCKKIYLEAFDDGDKSFTEMLFDTCFEYCEYCLSGDKVTAMLFALPCKLIGEKENKDVLYLYSVATLKEYRGQGIMTALIEKIKKQSNNTLLLLRPVNNSVTGFYEKLGFKNVDVNNNDNRLSFISPIGGYRELAQAVGCDSENFTAMYYSAEKSELKGLRFTDSMP